MEFRAAYRSGLIALACLLAVPAISQTCQTPFPVVDGQIHAGNSCSYGNSLPALDEIALPHPDVVYRLTSNSPLGGQLSFGATSSSNLIALVTSGCSTSGTVIASYDLSSAGSTVNLPVQPAGNYFLVITGDPALPASPAACGAFQFTPQINPAPTAGSCAAPLSFQSGQHPLGNTCSGSNTLPALLGLIASPQKELVYRINRASIANQRLYFDAPSANLLAAVMPTCSPTANVVASADLRIGSNTSLNLSSLPAGDHYLVITGDPAGAASGCGSFGFSDMEPGVVADRQTFTDSLQTGYYSQPFSVIPPGSTVLRRDYSGYGYGYRITPQGSYTRLVTTMGWTGVSSQALAVTSTTAPRTMRIVFNGAPVTAVGAVFGLTSTSLLYPLGSFTISIRSGTRVTTHTVVGSNKFRGFSSPTPIDEMAITSRVTPGNPTIDDLIVGTAR